MKAFNDDLVACVQPGGDEPAVADRAIDGEELLSDCILRVHEERIRVALGVPEDALLRQENRRFLDALDDGGADKHPGQQEFIGVREHRAEDDGAGGRIDRDVLELQDTLKAVGIAVGEDELEELAGAALIAIV